MTTAQVTELRNSVVTVDRETLRFNVTEKRFLDNASRGIQEKVKFVMENAITKLTIIDEKIATLLKNAKKTGIEGTKQDFFVLTKEELQLRRDQGLTSNSPESFAKRLSHLPMKLPLTFCLACMQYNIHLKLGKTDEQIKKGILSP